MSVSSSTNAKRLLPRTHGENCTWINAGPSFRFTNHAQGCPFVVVVRCRMIIANVVNSLSLSPLSSHPISASSFLCIARSFHIYLRVYVAKRIYYIFNTSLDSTSPSLSYSTPQLIPYFGLVNYLSCIFTGIFALFVHLLHLYFPSHRFSFQKYTRILYSLHVSSYCHNRRIHM